MINVHMKITARTAQFSAAHLNLTQEQVDVMWQEALEA